ncbi:hypothetical protein [Aquaspirillum sp. LM1]|uniref:hypothetical protein n=1 Tax=Aquaspirillum sp. LM1 TaxID=1938604 RepID=UPI0012374F59|nr:hypothetical protein [Aquaspirillum sp. LM1]
MARLLNQQHVFRMLLIQQQPIFLTAEFLLSNQLFSQVSAAQILYAGPTAAQARRITRSVLIEQHRGQPIKTGSHVCS